MSIRFDQMKNLITKKPLSSNPKQIVHGWIRFKRNTHTHRDTTSPVWWEFYSISGVFSQQSVTLPLSSRASAFKLRRTEATYNASVVTSGTPSNNSICRCFASLFLLAGARLLSIRRKSKAERRREPRRSGWRLEERERRRRQTVFNCTFAESRQADVQSWDEWGSGVASLSFFSLPSFPPHARQSRQPASSHTCSCNCHQRESQMFSRYLFGEMDHYLRAPCPSTQR